MSTLIFLLSVLLLSAAFLLFPKRAERESLFLWLTLAALFCMCWHTLAAALLQLFSVRIGLLSVGLSDLAPAAALLALTARKRRVQKYSASLWDGLAFGGLLLLTVLFGWKQYGSSLEIHYSTIDPAAHLQYAMDVLNTGRVTGFFYSSLNTGLFLGVCGNFLPADCLYKAFLLQELFHLFLSGAMFWHAAGERVKDPAAKIALLLLTAFYTAGYPLNNAIFGFNYLGMGVTLTALLIFSVNRWLRDRAPLYAVLILLGCTGLMLSYVLFVPVVFGGIFLSVNGQRLREKKLLTRGTVLLNLALFLVPCAVGILYPLRSIFLSTGLTVTGQINKEGAGYRELFADFLPVLPAALFGAMTLRRRKENTVLLTVSLLQLLFMAANLLLVLTGHVSTYYYFKNNYLLWLLLFLLAASGLTLAEKRERRVFACLYGVVLLLFAGWFTGLEDKMRARSELLAETKRGDSLFPVYAYNKLAILAIGRRDANQTELFCYAERELLESGEAENVIGILDWEESIWFQALSGWRDDRFDYWNDSWERFLELYGEEEYFLVLRSSGLAAQAGDWLSELNVIYENPAGFIGRLPGKTQESAE